MNKFFFSLLTFVAMLMVTACSNDKTNDAFNENLRKIVTRHIQANVNDNEKLEISEISKPDSIFGLLYLPEKDLAYIAKMNDKVTEYFMKKTDNMSKMDSNDGQLAYIANKQMLVAAQMNDIFSFSMQKGNFCGWVVKANYTVKNKRGTRKTREWFFIDKDGSFIYNTFAIPLI